MYCNCKPGPEYAYVKVGLLTKVTVSLEGDVYNRKFMGRTLAQGAKEQVSRGRMYCPKCDRLLDK